MPLVESGRPHREPHVEGGDAAGAVLGEARRQLVLQARRGVALDAELQVLDRRQVAAHRGQGRVRDGRGRRDARRAACAWGRSGFWAKCHRLAGHRAWTQDDIEVVVMVGSNAIVRRGRRVWPPSCTCMWPCPSLMRSQIIFRRVNCGTLWAIVETLGKACH